MDGFERTRSFKEMRIRFGDQGDIEAGLEVGTGVALAIGVLALGVEEGTRPVDGRKLYL